MQASSVDAVRRILVTAGVVGSALTLSAAAALPALASGQHGNSGTGHNPPGNNGTVFIHQAAGDSHPHNQPHVTCTFYVSLFGYDKGQSLSVSFAGQAPTGKDVQLPVTDGTPTTLTSSTDAGGAGQDYDGDLGAFGATNLDVANKLGAPAKQGWHITLTVDTGQGGGHKYKVFWLAPCASTAGTVGTGSTTTPGTSTTSTPTGTTPGTTGATSGGATVAGTSTSAVTPTSGRPASSVQVLGERITRRPAGNTQVLGTSATRTTSLPFTGAEIGLMSAAGLAGLGGGAALLVAGRRRRRAALDSA